MPYFEPNDHTRSWMKLSCRAWLKIAAKYIHGEDEATQKMEKSCSRQYYFRLCKLLADDLKEQLYEKLRDNFAFGLQIDDTTDMAGEAQLLVYCRFSDVEKENIVDHYICCLPISWNHSSGHFLYFDALCRRRWNRTGEVSGDNNRWSCIMTMTGRINWVVKKAQTV